MIHEDWDVGKIGDEGHPWKYDIALLELEVMFHIDILRHQNKGCPSLPILQFFKHRSKHL